MEVVWSPLKPTLTARRPYGDLIATLVRPLYVYCVLRTTMASLLRLHCVLTASIATLLRLWVPTATQVRLLVAVRTQNKRNKVARDVLRTP
ncbi:hypothetical protein DPMN_122709 [Dreissena polymorpha]|uniref:Uncharacterized protein n=1 Tax=Dreissena polymorpha TaxID=45954 RepID=A0A9D4JQT7_DREPO|nr:hypothetical protein DPMN_122709 [Dreissena polymorpha]